MYVDGRYVAERRRNLLVRSLTGARILSALQLPFFIVLPPGGYGVITTTGRRTGRRRRKCIRAIRSGDRAYLVSIPGPAAAWVKNIRANPDIRLRIRGGSFRGLVRDPRDAGEIEEAMRAYCETLKPFDYMTCLMHRRGIPTRSKIEDLLRGWFEGGTPLVVELAP